MAGLAERGCGAGGRNDRLHPQRLHAALGPAQLAGDELFKAGDVFFRWRISVQKFFGETNGPERDADRLLDALVFGERDFAAAAPDVDQQAAARGARLVVHDAAMDKTAFFETRDDFYLPARLVAHPGKKGAGVAGVAHRSRGHGADSVSSMQLGGTMKAFQSVECSGHGLGRDEAGLENTAAKPRDFTVLMQDFKLVLDYAGDLEPAGIGTYVDCGKRLHAWGVHSTSFFVSKKDTRLR